MTDKSRSRAPRIIRGLLAALALSAPHGVRAKPTEAGPGQTTIWDELMAAQANRGLRTGYALMEARDYEAAIKEFAKAVVSNPADPLGHLMLGSAHYWAGNVPQAETEFREGLRLDPKNAQAHLLIGIVHAWRGETAAAYAAFQEGAKLDPARADLQMDLGSIEETMGRYPEALEHFRRAVALEPEHPLYHYQIGMLYRRLGRDADAVDSLGAALKRYPEFEDAALELGAAHERLGQADEALELFKKAVKLKARDSVARYRLGRSHLLRGELKKARAVFADAFHLTPEDSAGGLALSVAFGGAAQAPAPGEGGKGAPGRKPEEPAGAPKAPETPSTDPLDVLSRNLERIPLDQEAQLQVEMAFLPRPQLMRAKPSESPSSLKKALAEAGRAPKPSATGVRREFRLRAANAAEQREQVRKIVEELREVLKAAPADAEVRMGMNLNYAPKSALPAGPGQGGSGHGDSKAKVSYQPRQVGNDMGLWVMGTGWMALVEETLPEPGETPSHPDTADWWVAAGLGQAALGNAKSALLAFERAIRLDAANEQAWLGRAVALVEAGRDVEAVESLKKVLQLQPKNRVAKDGLRWLLREPKKT
ncbi:MAG: tetratricopeptide repeat protein [Elusimicrobia bacterium]|nr:tetratricopeptide repeat protein [Elusimicrobiota bacterium]